VATVSIRDLRRKAGEVVDRAARGEAITITKAGKPVVELLRALTVRAERDDIKVADATHMAAVDDGQERNRDHRDDQHV
jgi:prevent-host-death family protein